DLCNGREFDSHPVWKRMLTVIAGPATNLICAYIFFVFLGLSGVSGLKPVVGSVLDASPAQKANIQPNDEIISLNGNKVLLWQDMLWYSLSVLGEPDVPIVIEDIDGNTFEKNINLEDASLADLESTSLNAVIGMGPRYIELKPIIGDVLTDSAAQTAGLETGDEIVAINGKYITTWREFSQSIRTSPNQNLELKVARDDNIITLNLIPASNPTAPENGLAGIRVGLPEVVPGSVIFDEYYTTATYPLSQVWNYAFKQTSETLKLTVTSLYQLLIGKLGLDSLGGPISIVQNVGISVEIGLQSFIRMMAFINLSLFFFNLLPIPVLDGGHLVNHVIEAVTKRKPSEKFLRNY
ncbi:MAG: RIP metalloprotease RseP, partial [Gammaproteobacteria bacterium]|nr:RIP metalloprotease RseP [Gammaproteobacteria bacterium]